MPFMRGGGERIPPIVKRPATQEMERGTPEEQMNEDTVKNAWREKLRYPRTQESL